MSTATLAETRDRIWSPILESVHAPALDCLQTSLALLTDRHHGPGTHLALGARIGFTARWGTPPSLETSVEQRLTEAAALTGLRVTERRADLDGPSVRRFAAEAETLYVLADAFAMRWTPYHGMTHLEHSFLLVPDGDRWKVVDAYHNETQRGVARPGVWRLTADELDAALRDGATAMVFTADPCPPLDPATILAGNVAAFTSARPDIGRYLTAVRAGVAGPDTAVAAIQQLVLDVWLLGRARLLHSAWLATVPGVTAASLHSADAHAQAWLRLAAESYVAMRRAQRGSDVPEQVLRSLASLLHDDVALAASVVAGFGVPDTAGTAPADIRAAVVEAVRAVLQVDDATVAAARTFRELPNFNSFRLVDIVERVEERLNLELDADALTGNALHDLDTLAQAFTVNARRSPTRPDQETDR